MHLPLLLPLRLPRIPRSGTLLAHNTLEIQRPEQVRRKPVHVLERGGLAPVRVEPDAHGGVGALADGLGPEGVEALKRDLEEVAHLEK